jgi:hypothetical protein
MFDGALKSREFYVLAISKFGYENAKYVNNPL